MQKTVHLSLELSHSQLINLFLFISKYRLSDIADWTDMSLDALLSVKDSYLSLGDKEKDIMVEQLCELLKIVMNIPSDSNYR